MGGFPHTVGGCYHRSSKIRFGPLIAKASTASSKAGAYQSVTN